MIGIILEFFLKLISSFVGTLGFAIFMHAPKRAWLPASAIGGIAYALYWALLQCGVHEPMSIFIAALLGSILGQICARRMHMIATIFVLLSLIPLVPGLGLYRCMRYLAQEMYGAGADAGVRAMVDIVMIALGLAVGNFIFRAFLPRKPKGDSQCVHGQRVASTHPSGEGWPEKGGQGPTSDSQCVHWQRVASTRPNGGGWPEKGGAPK